MADAMQRGESLFLVKGAIRELHDGRLYVVTESGFLEDMREVVTCKDCKHFRHKEWRLDEDFNEAEKDACCLFSDSDFDWNYTRFWYVEPDGFCAWGELRDKCE